MEFIREVLRAVHLIETASRCLCGKAEWRLKLGINSSSAGIGYKSPGVLRDWFSRVLFLSRRRWQIIRARHLVGFGRAFDAFHRVQGVWILTAKKWTVRLSLSWKKLTSRSCLPPTREQKPLAASSSPWRSKLLAFQKLSALSLPGRQGRQAAADESREASPAQCALQTRWVPLLRAHRRSVASGFCKPSAFSEEARHWVFA